MFNPETRVLHNIKIEIYKKYVANNFWLVFFLDPRIFKIILVH